MHDVVRDHPWELRYGARVLSQGGVEFRVWAPRLRSLSVVILQSPPIVLPMLPEAGDEFAVVAPEIGAGIDYALLTESGRQLPDPVSRWQPAGVHGPSRIVDPATFSWSDQHWQGVPLTETIIYELHTGTFTPEGTFEAIIPKLADLKRLGITALELMPVAEFPGTRNWGYDGVSLYAPHSRYDGPAGLKRLVDACHNQGIAVILDVVYNHFGPEGNYLGEFAPCFTARYRTPWGDAINFDGPDSDGVRRFFIDNALYWLTEYHMDALRLDAIHEIFDLGARPFLEELADVVHRQGERLERPARIIAESDLNDVRIIKSRLEGGYGLDAQWLEDFHHSLHAALGKANRGYLADFGKLADLKKAICEGFVFDGQYSKYRRRHFGNSSVDRPGNQFVAYIQNHDQIANACLGSRMAEWMSPDEQKLAAAVVLMSPFVPMLFMGEEYGETAPFLFFTSFGEPRLAEAVRAGRRQEYAAFYANREFPDPEAPSTFERSRLRWDSAQRMPHAGIWRFHYDLIALRKRYACLSNCRKDLARTALSEKAKWLVMERGDPSGSFALLICNFSLAHQTIPMPYDDIIWRLELWSGAPAYGGRGSAIPPVQLAREGGDSPQVEVPGSCAIIYIGQK
jgi:maltooligosyltrehalose trehalohydrolase